MTTFSITTLGCKTNQYESQQIAQLLRARGLVQVEPGGPPADLRVINTCAVTVQASSKSRQSVRRATELAVPGQSVSAGTGGCRQHRVIVTGCWSTSDKANVSRMPGVDAALGHDDDAAAAIDHLLSQWFAGVGSEQHVSPRTQQSITPIDTACARGPEAAVEDQWKDSGRIPALSPMANSQPHGGVEVKAKMEHGGGGMRSLPLLSGRQEGMQRALLKVQDGCDAHCTYCIIPQLRRRLWSKPVTEVVEEARSLVAAGHGEIVLTGIFLGAYGQSTALHRRQSSEAAQSLGRLVEAICDGVAGLRRLRLSSLEPADLTEELLATLRRWRQVVPHLHLPLQSGSDRLLRRMNRQYTRDQYLRMVERVREAFDRPAITTDIIVGFPGETDEEFERTLDVVDRAGFIHVHAFHYSPRPGTAAARWTDERVRGEVVNDRIAVLRRRARARSHEFRQGFVGQVVELLVERCSDGEGGDESPCGDLRHGRCERYFSVSFEGPASLVGRAVRVRVDEVTETRTRGTLIEE
jgi:threonylcarbamoyladenosine tRNA methylthiotransferase MtaB